MMLRTLYEHIQLNRFWILPAVVVLIVSKLDLAWRPPSAQWGIVLLTLIYLFWFCLPRPDWWELAVYYRHDRIFRSTVLTGLIAAGVYLSLPYQSLLIPDQQTWLLWIVWTDTGLALFSCLYRWYFTYKKGV